MLLTSFVLAVVPQSPSAALSRDLAAILRAEPACVAVLDHAKAHRLQVLLAEPVEGEHGVVTLHRSRLGDPAQYFYPASAIKLCGAVAVLLTLNEHNRRHGTALGLSSKLVIEPRFAGDQRIEADPSNVVDGTLTVAHMLRKLLLVSDNAAFNHCFDLCGQDGLNRAMWNAGLPSVRVTAFANYTRGPFGLNVQQRWHNSTRRSSDPAQVWAVGRVPSFYTTDLTATYNLAMFGGNNQFFVTAQNLFDKKPPAHGGTGGAASVPGLFLATTNGDDFIGRYFTFGFRFRH